MKGPSTYKNVHGESMHIRNEYVLTIDHDDVGKIYFLPVGDGLKVRAFAVDQGKELIPPENLPEGVSISDLEKLVLYTYEQVVLSQEEMDIITAHRQG